MIILGYLVILATIGENLAFPGPSLVGIPDRRSVVSGSSTKAVVYLQAPNLNNEWVMNIRTSPYSVSIYDSKDSVPVPPPLAKLAEYFTRRMICSVLVELDKPASDPSKITSTVLFNENDAKGTAVVLTDNKTYFVGVSKDERTKIAIVNRLVQTLDPVEETKIKDKLTELGFRTTPSTVIRKDECSRDPDSI